jgi:aryl-alcohol dehydrogenase
VTAPAPTPVEAWVHRGPGDTPRREPLQLGVLRPDELRVRLAACGVCHTDLFAPRLVPLPAVLGHEGAGVVEEVGSRVATLRPGDRVVLTFGSCGECVNCRDGAPAYCLRGHELQFGGQRADGSGTFSGASAGIHGAFFQQSSFATHAIATERNAVRIPDALTFERAAPLGCGVQTGAGAVLNTLACREGSSLAVFGAGSVGLSAVMAARLAGCARVIAVDVLPQRLALARELGATCTLDAREGDVASRIVSITGGGVHYSIETAGTEGSFRDAIDCLLRRGVCGLCTVPRLGEPIEFRPLSILKGRTVTGVLEGSSVPHEFIPRLARLHLEGRLPYDRLITGYDFADLPRALDDAAQGKVVKAVLRMPVAAGQLEM